MPIFPCSNGIGLQFLQRFIISNGPKFAMVTEVGIELPSVLELYDEESLQSKVFQGGNAILEEICILLNAAELFSTVLLEISSQRRLHAIHAQSLASRDFALYYRSPSRSLETSDPNNSRFLIADVKTSKGWRFSSVTQEDIEIWKSKEK